MLVVVQKWIDQNQAPDIPTPFPHFQEEYSVVWESTARDRTIYIPGFLMLEWRGTARNGKEWQADKKPLQFAEDS